jgi:hypothetical protein
VLDPPDVPEHKSFPPRLVIIVLGAFSGLACAVAALIAKAQWDEIEPDAAKKALAREVFSEFNRHMPWATPNGSRVQAASHKVWKRFGKRDIET